MSRVRNIKPGYTTDEKIAELPIPARYFFAVLWTRCDLNGVFEWRPRWLKVELFPYDKAVTPEVIERWLCALITLGKVIRFQDGTKQFGAVYNWHKHQAISLSERKQRIESEQKHRPVLPIPPVMGDAGEDPVGVGEENGSETVSEQVEDRSKTQDLGPRTQDGGGASESPRDPPPASLRGLRLDWKTRMRALLSGLGFGANDLDVLEWGRMAKDMAKCSSMAEVGAFLAWVKKVAAREKATVRHARHAETLANQWNDYARAEHYQPPTSKATA